MPEDAEVAQVLAEITELQGRLQQAYEAGDPAAVDRLLSELSAAERRRNRMMTRSVAGRGGGGGYRSALPVREQVARVLGLCGRPAAVSLIRELAAARFGDQIPSPRLASLRRDEHRSWRSAQEVGAARAKSRPVYVVPALTYDRLAPVRGLLALSSWPLRLRVLAPASQRVDLLYIVDRLAEELTTAGSAGWAPEVERILWRLAATVPGATDTAGGFELETVRAAVAAELSQIGEPDTAERTSAAQRVGDQLDLEQQLFGSRLTALPGSQSAA